MTSAPHNPPRVRLLRPSETSEEPYQEFEPQIERALVYACCTIPRFWSLIGTHLHPACLRDPRGAELLRACASVARDTGEGPTRPAVVAQRLRADHDSGRLPMSALESALQLVTDVEDIDGGIPSIEELVALAAPVLRRRALTRAIRDAVTDHGKGKSLLARAREIEAAERIGHETSVGSTALTNSVWTAIEDLRRVDRLKTGIDALDQALGGGFTARSLVTLAAATNVGKTAMLVHVACYAWLCGRRVIFLPTEEGVSNTLTRIVSWISGIPIDRVALSDPLAKQRFADRLAQYNSGSLFVEYLPQGSTVGQLRRLVTKIQDDHEALRDGYDVLIVDYADKMDAPGEKAYDKMKVVYEGLRQLAVDHNNWTITASQVKQIQDKDRVRPDVNDLSDSSWKGRTSDAVITIYRDPNDIHARSFYVAKNRGPGVGAEIGPVPSQLERARIVPLLAGLFDEDDDP